jgi:ABC-type branched-subunit amino acid transport system permease subunit
MKMFWSLLNGQLEPGRSWAFWVPFAVLLFGALILPTLLSRYALLNVNSFLLMAPLAAGLALLWGYGGVLSLGQSAFFGIGGYAYGIVAINLASTRWASLAGLGAGLVSAMSFAAALSWIVFYGRLRGVYVSIVTLVVTLVIETFLNQTAGPQWVVGSAHLGGNNGLGRFSGSIEELPNLSLPLGEGPFEFAGSSQTFYYLVLFVIVVSYLAMRALVNSRFGIALTAVREDSDRVETLGYDVRLIQTAAFCVAAALAAISGVLYTCWGNFITPSVFGVGPNILPVIWVAVAGRKSIAAAILGAIVMQWGSQALAMQGEYAFVVQGALLVLAVLVMPEGVISIGDLVRRARMRRAGRQMTAGA